MYTFHFIQQLCAGQGADYITACKAGKCLSADVTAAYDPTFADAFEPDNATYAGNGVAIYKYTGARGKSGTSDACAEMVSYLTRLLEKNNVVWQIGEMGKLDLGGGGTVAKYVANQDIDTIDIGVPVLSMHAPVSYTHLDVYKRQPVPGRQARKCATPTNNQWAAVLQCRSQYRRTRQNSRCASPCRE